jgi:AcrR family transcriptional regulator
MADRPRAHDRSTETEATILAATERLLERGPLSQLSVAGILEESGISRATFYFYFSSKFAVVTSLLTKLYDDMFEVVQPYVARDESKPPDAALREALDAGAALWGSHRAALRAVHEHWPMIPELREVWLRIMERFTDAVGARIDKDRRAKVASPGPDSRQLAAALLWGTDRCLYVAGLAVDPNLPAERDAVDPLVAIWFGSIYGASANPKRKRGAQKPK